MKSRHNYSSLLRVNSIWRRLDHKLQLTTTTGFNSDSICIRSILYFMLCSRLSGVELVNHAWQGLRSGVLVSPQGGGPVVWTWRSNCGTCSYITLCSTGRTIIHLWHFSLNFTTISKYQHLLNRLLLSGEWKSVCIRQLIAGKKKKLLHFIICHMSGFKNSIWDQSSTCRNQISLGRQLSLFAVCITCLHEIRKAFVNMQVKYYWKYF